MCTLELYKSNNSSNDVIVESGSRYLPASEIACRSLLPPACPDRLLNGAILNESPVPLGPLEMASVSGSAADLPLVVAMPGAVTAFRNAQCRCPAPLIMALNTSIRAGSSVRIALSVKRLRSHRLPPFRIGHGRQAGIAHNALVYTRSVPRISASNWFEDFFNL